MIPSLIHPVSHFRSVRAAWFVQKLSQEETTVVMPLQSGQSVLDVLGKKIIKKELQTTTHGCQVHLKRWLILYLWIKTFQISLFTQHCHSGWQPSRTMVQKCVEWIILLLIEEDQNKSSANLFSGLRSGVWCNETQISYLFYHSKNTSGDFDYWTAVKWYPFFSF